MYKLCISHLMNETQEKEYSARYSLIECLYVKSHCALGASRSLVVIHISFESGRKASHIHERITAI